MNIEHGRATPTSHHHHQDHEPMQWYTTTEQ